MPDGPPTPPLSPDHALDWPGRTANADAVLAAVERRVQRRRQLRRRALAATAALAVVVLAGFAWVRPFHPAPPTGASLATSATLTQPTRQLLADGSQIELNGDAQVRVEYSPAIRRVTILRGEAHFAVAHDTARPFVVIAGEVAVRAVGTAFAVRLAPGDVNVLVTDGRVAVDRATADPIAAPVQPLAFVSKGARVAVAPADLAPHAPAPAVVEVTAPELAAQLAWRVPRLEFNDTPLRDAVALFNRHGTVRLALGAPALGELRVSGIVRADNTAALLQLLRSDYGVEAQPRGEREFVLSRPR
jgi:transmembrane sensor